MKGAMLLGSLRIKEEELEFYIKEIASGNETVLEQFYNDYGKVILALILTIVKTRESAEEVLQDVLMSIVTHNSDISVVNAAAWLFKIIQNLSKKKAMEDKAMQMESLSENEDLRSENDVSESVEESVDQIEALQCLDPLEQQCVIMRVFGHIKLPQVAKLLGLSYNQVRSKYNYAVKKLKKYYEEGGGLM